MIGAHFLVLVFVCAAASAQDEKEYELAELSKEIKKELRQKQEIQAEELEDAFDEKPEVRSHILHLNSTERHKLEEALQATTKQLGTLETELAEKNCPSKEIEIERQGRDSESLENSKSCSQLQKDYLNAKMAMHVLTGAKLVDEEISRGLPFNDETRQKRSLERRELLKSNAQELKEAAKRLGHDKTTPPLNRRKRTTIEQLASQTCSATKSFERKHSNTAKDEGHTIQVEAGGDVGIFYTVSAGVSHVYGQNGEFGCAATACTGWSTNIGFSGGVMAGFYFNFEDVKGDSITTLYSLSYGFGSILYGYIETPDGRHIGDVTGVSAGISVSLIFPFGYSSTTCDTIMTVPNCTKKKVKTRQKYYASCGWLGWSRCSRYRTAYRHEYSCI